MRVLVTGGAGFIGSNLVDRLLADGHDVAVVDDFSSGRRENLADAATHGRFRLHEIDVRDPAIIALADELRPEVICHLAAQISVRKSVTDPVHDASVNVQGTASVLSAAQAASTRKVVFASSVAVYGRPATIPVPGDAATDPRSPYAASKLSGGDLPRHVQGALRHRIHHAGAVQRLRPAPVARRRGRGGRHLHRRLLSGTPTVLYGDGTQTRDYIFVEDVVDGFVRACGADGNGRRFNLGTGVQTTDRRLHAAGRRRGRRAGRARVRPAAAG